MAPSNFMISEFLTNCGGDSGVEMEMWIRKFILRESNRILRFLCILAGTSIVLL